MERKSLWMLVMAVMWSVASFAQTIEVHVEEKITLQAVEFNYLITFGSPMDELSEALENLSVDEEENEGEDLELDEPNLEELEMTLEQQKFNVRRVDHTEDLFSGESEALEVTLKTKSELDRLEKLLDTFDELDGYISSVTYEDPDKYFESAYPKLIQKAQNEAAILASASGRTLGAVLAIHEVGHENDAWSSLFDNYAKMLGKFRLFKEMGSNALTQDVELKFMVRFELK
jgi:hypothetical protein